MTAPQDLPEVVTCPVCGETRRCSDASKIELRHGVDGGQHMILMRFTA